MMAGGGGSDVRTTSPTVAVRSALPAACPFPAPHPRPARPARRPPHPAPPRAATPRSLAHQGTPRSAQRGKGLLVRATAATLRCWRRCRTRTQRGGFRNRRVYHRGLHCFLFTTHSHLLTPCLITTRQAGRRKFIHSLIPLNAFISAAIASFDYSLAGQSVPRRGSPGLRLGTTAGGTGRRDGA